MAKNIVIIGEYSNNDIIYISNTNPICWTNEKYLAKKYEYIYEAINDIVSEYGVYKTTILGTKLKYISVLDISNDKIIPVIDSEGNLLIDDDD